MWLVYVNGDANSPYHFEDQGAMATYMSNLPAGSVVIVEQYDMVLRNTTAYGVTGGPPFPTPPAPKPALASFDRIHYKRQ